MFFQKFFDFFLFYKYLFCCGCADTSRTNAFGSNAMFSLNRIISKRRTRTAATMRNHISRVSYQNRIIGSIIPYEDNINQELFNLVLRDSELKLNRICDPTETLSHIRRNKGTDKIMLWGATRVFVYQKLNIHFTENTNVVCIIHGGCMKFEIDTITRTLLDGATEHHERMKIPVKTLGNKCFLSIDSYSDADNSWITSQDSIFSKVYALFSIDDLV